MKTTTFTKGLYFLNKAVCESDKIACTPPCVLEFHGEDFSGEVFFASEQNARCENANVVFGDGEVLVFFQKENCDCVLKKEFVANANHTAYCYGNGVECECEGDSFTFFERGFEDCTCVRIGGSDYIFFKFESRIVAILFQGGKYRHTLNVLTSRFQLDSKTNRLKVEFSPPTCCGCTLFSDVDFTALSENPQNGGNGFFANAMMKNVGNFKKETFAVYFFELLYLARYLHPQKRGEFLKNHLSEDLTQNLDAVLSYLGDFCGVLPCEDFAILTYFQNENLKTKAFKLEMSQNGSFIVENISEVEKYSIETVGLSCFDDLSFTK